ARVADDQVRLYVGAGRQRLVDGVRMPDGVLESPAAVVRLLSGAAANVVLDALDAVADAGRLLRDEGAAPAPIPRQVGGDVAELGREVLVDEQDVHDRGTPSRTLERPS